MKPCEEYFESIIEYALGDGAELTQIERARLEAHLATCVGCRGQLRSTRTILYLIRTPMNIKVPHGVTQALNVKVMKAIRSDAKWTISRRAAELVAVFLPAALVMLMYPSLQRGEPSPAATITGSVREIGDPYSPRSSPHTIAEQLDTKQYTPKLASPRTAMEHRFAAIHDPASAIAFLREQCNNLRNPNSDTPHIEAVMRLCDLMPVRWPATHQSIEAIRISSRALWIMGKHTESQDKFLQYADALAQARSARPVLCVSAGVVCHVNRGAQDKLKHLTEIVHDEARRLFWARDFLSATCYYDHLISRYPGSDGALQARYMLGCICAESGDLRNAIRTYERLIHEHPDSYAAQLARTDLPDYLFNTGRRQDAVDVWLDFSRHATADSDKAAGIANAGHLLAAQGGPRCVDAIRLFNKVLKEYPDASCTPSVKSQVRLILAKPAKLQVN